MRGISLFQLQLIAFLPLASSYSYRHMGASSSSQRQPNAAHRVERPPIKITVDARTEGGVLYTVVDGPATGAAKGSTAAGSAQRLRTLRHPNILAFSRLSDGATPKARKGSVMGLPLVQHLPEALAGGTASSSFGGGASSSAHPPLTPSEALLGLKGIAEAMAVCCRAGVFFRSLSLAQVGVALEGDTCHAVNARRWVLLDLTTADGTSAADSAKAFITFVYDVMSAMDPMVLTAAATQRWGGAGAAEALRSAAPPLFSPLAAAEWAGAADGNPFDLLLWDEEVPMEAAAPQTYASSGSSGSGGNSTAAAEEAAADPFDDSPDVPGVSSNSPSVATANTNSGGGGVRLVSTAGRFFDSVAALIDVFNDPLLEAMAIGQALPSYYAADSLSTTAGASASAPAGNAGVSEELQGAYDRLGAVVEALAVPLAPIPLQPSPPTDRTASSSRSPSPPSPSAGRDDEGNVARFPPNRYVPVELRRCVLPWLAAPEHLAQPVSAHLFTRLLQLSRGSRGDGHGGHGDGASLGLPTAESFVPLIRACVESSDPFLNARFFALAAAVAPVAGGADLFALAEGIAYTCHRTAAALAGEWATAGQVRYCRAVVKAAEPILAEMRVRARPPKGPIAPAAASMNASGKPFDGRAAFIASFASVAAELTAVLFAAVACVEEGSSDHIAEVGRLMRDALVAACALVPVGASSGASPPLVSAAGGLKKAIMLSLYQWGPFVREQCASVVVSAIGTTIPFASCGFLLAAMLSLCGAPEVGIRNAACTGLLRLKGAMGVIPAGSDDAVVRECMALAAAGGAAAAFAPAARPESGLLQAYATLESKRLTSAGYADGGALIAAMGKERAKVPGGGALAPAPPRSPFNAVFRSGDDKATYVAVLHHSAF